MRVALLLLSAGMLASCATLEPDHIPVYGEVWTVSTEDIRAAFAAARAGDPKNRTARIYNVKVHNRDEIYVAFGNDGLGDEGPEAQVKRIRGKWHYIETWRVVVTS